jgi:hypothetical protein
MLVFLIQGMNRHLEQGDSAFSNLHFVKVSVSYYRVGEITTLSGLKYSNTGSG